MPFVLAGLGAKQVMLRKVNGTQILRRVQAHGVTLMCSAPTVVNGVLDALQHWDGPVPGRGRVRIVVAGAPPPTRTIERVETELGWEFIQLYGPTETSPLLTVNRSRAEWDALPVTERAQKLGRAGAPALATQLCIDEHGEVLARSNMVLEGNWQQPEGTAAAVVDGWFHTGDGGRLDSEGHLTISDRKKDIIITGGENVASIEVEDALFCHTAVAEVAVIGVPHDKWGETVKALVVLAPGTLVTEQALIDHCRQRLAHYKCPTSVEFRSELARTATGKLQKFSCARRTGKAARDRSTDTHSGPEETTRRYHRNMARLYFRDAMTHGARPFFIGEPRMKHSSFGVTIICSCSTLFAGCGHGGLRIASTPPTEPNKPAIAVAGLAEIGTVLSISEHNGVLYVAASKGLAAVGADQKVLWTLALPERQVRFVSSDDTGIVWSAYDTDGVAKGGSIARAMLGDNADVHTFSSAALGTASLTGQAGWTADLADKTNLSPPGLAGDVIAVTTLQQIRLYGRSAAPGAPLAAVDCKESDAAASHFARLQPVAIGEVIVASNNGNIYALDHKGKPMDDTNAKGDVVGMGRCGDRVALGTGHGVQGYAGNFVYQSVDYTVSSAGKISKLRKMNALSPASEFSTSGDHCIVGSNFDVTSFGGDGTELWIASNDKGSLYPSSGRGTFRQSGQNIFVRRTTSHFLAANARQIFTTANPAGAKDDGSRDAIIVLDAIDGHQIARWKTAGGLADLTLVGEALAFLDVEGLKVISLAQ